MKKPMTRTRRMYSKGGVAGGKKTKGKTGDGKLEMVEKDGKTVPFFAADGEGKMMAGGSVPGPKGYFKGGKVMSAGGMVPDGPRIPQGTLEKVGKGGKG